MLRAMLHRVSGPVGRDSTAEILCGKLRATNYGWIHHAIQPLRSILRAILHHVSGPLFIRELQPALNGNVSSEKLLLY